MMDIKAPLPATSTLPPRAVAPRTTEETDAHTSLDQEDMDRHKRGKRTDAENRERKDIYEDLTEVSVALLRGFLQNLMATRDEVERKRATVARTQPYALAAYSHAQRAAPDAPPVPSVGDDAEILGVSRVELAAENLDKGEIRDLMTALERVEAAGISFISIEKSSSFLQSIRDGIARLAQNPVA